MVDHNAKRMLHCDTPPLVYSAALEAETKAFVETCPTEHASFDDRGGTGENMYWAGASSAPVGSEATGYTSSVEVWYDEIDNYDFASSESAAGGVIGHFTQTVWRASTSVGCAAKLDCDNKFPGFKNSVIVCRYDPPGNFIGQNAAEIGPLVTSGSCGAAAARGAAIEKASAAKASASKAKASAALMPPDAPTALA